MLIGLKDLEKSCNAFDDDLMDIDISRQKGKNENPRKSGMDLHRHAFFSFSADERRYKLEILLQVMTVPITLKTLRDALQGVRRPFYLWSNDNGFMLSKIREIEKSSGSYRPNGYMERLSTFKCKNNPNGIIWNEDQMVKPEQLVSAGFSFDGKKDQVICKLCKCTSDVNTWDRNDDEYAFSVHKGLSKDCKFVRTYDGSSFAEKVQSDYTYFFQTIIYTSKISEKLSQNTYVKVDSYKSLKHYYDYNADKFKEDSICTKMLVCFEKCMHTFKFYWSQMFCKKYIYK